MAPRRGRRIGLVAALLLVCASCGGGSTAGDVVGGGPSTVVGVPTTSAVQTSVVELDEEQTYRLELDGAAVDAYDSAEAETPTGVIGDAAGVAGVGALVVAAPYDRFETRYEVHTGDGGLAWVDAGDVDVEAVNVVAVGRGTDVDADGGGGGDIEVFPSEAAAGPPTTVTNPMGAEGRRVAPVAFLLRAPFDPSADVHEVFLPVRPNGSTGFVRAEDVELVANTFRIEVSLSERELRVLDGSDVVMREPIAVGTDNTPTPGGVFFIRSLIASTDPAYGTFAFGLSGFSDVHDTFNGGPGDIGIHGTNDPSSIGRDVSNGCIRLADDAVIALAGLLPEAGPQQSEDPRRTTGLGVPVEVLP